MKLYIATCVLMSLLLGCNTNKPQDEIAYLGGVIINPKNNYVTVYSNEAERDTIFLDRDNRFIYKIDNLKTGLYSFTHGGEYQTLLIEPNDSILFRLNTNDFDESLVYTGKGSIKNNFIIKAFLSDEVESKKIANNQHLEPEAFEKFVRDLKKQKLESLERFTATHQTSDLFKKVAEAGIHYNYYTYMEMYPFGYFGNNQLIHFKDLPENFYDYRKDVDFNDESISALYAYNRFLLWHFQNIALKEYYEDGSHNVFDRHALSYNLDKLKLIDSIVENETIKNYLLMHTTREFIFNSDNEQKTKSMLHAYFEVCTNNEHKDYMNTMAESTINLFPGNVIPSIEVIDFGNNTLDLHHIIESPTVIYCWSSNFKMSYRNNHYMMRRLKKKYPNMHFIAININDMDSHSWKKTLNLLKYPTQNEYMFKNPNEAIKTFAIGHSQKVMVVDEDKIIVNPNADLFSDHINHDIEKALAPKEKLLTSN